MARKPPQRPNAEEPDATVDEARDGLPAVDPSPTAADAADVAETDAAETEVADIGDEPTTSSAGTGGTDRSLWTRAKVDPIELALPGGVGYTLRAYRLSTELAPTDIQDREEDDDPFSARAVDDEDDDEVIILDEEYAALVAEEEPSARKSKRGDSDDDSDEDDEDETAGDDAVEAATDKPDEDDEDEDEEAAEEVPFFLSHRGKLLLFKSPESLVTFIRSGAPHDLAQLETWSELAERIEPADVTATGADSYELDLVVENLRGGYDTWDLDLLIRAGEVARDLAYALRLPPVLTALSAGTPLDDLDEALRSAAGGGIGGFMGRRRLRRIGAQQASLGWRTIIGKISAAVDWRD